MAYTLFRNLPNFNNDFWDWFVAYHDLTAAKPSKNQRVLVPDDQPVVTEIVIIKDEKKATQLPSGFQKL
jgi:hypothetical protein